ncbi:MAG: hypothetical protein ACOY3Z_11180 [Thermodesulfobacteriota bacterium]
MEIRWKSLLEIPAGNPWEIRDRTHFVRELIHINPHYPTPPGLLGFICQTMFLVASVFIFEYNEYIM